MKQNKKRFPWLMAAAVVLAAGIVVCAAGYFSVKAENDRLQEELLQAEEDLQEQEALAEEAGKRRRPERKPCRQRRRRRRQPLFRRKRRPIWGIWRMFPPEPWYLRRRSTGRIWSSILRVMKFLTVFSSGFTGMINRIKLTVRCRARICGILRCCITASTGRCWWAS